MPDHNEAEQDRLAEVMAAHRFVPTRSEDGTLDYGWCAGGDSYGTNHIGEHEQHVAEVMLRPRTFGKNCTCGADAEEWPASANVQHIDACPLREPPSGSDGGGCIPYLVTTAGVMICESCGVPWAEAHPSIRPGAQAS